MQKWQSAGRTWHCQEIMDEAFMEAASDSYTKGVDIDLSAPFVRFDFLFRHGV